MLYLYGILLVYNSILQFTGKLDVIGQNGQRIQIQRTKIRIGQVVEFVYFRKKY